MKALTRIAGLAALLSLALLTPVHVIGQSVEIPEVLNLPASVGDVEFPHLMHIEDLEIECSECHHSTRAAALDMPHEDYFEDFWIDCKICHVPGEAPQTEQACSKCHPRRPSSISDETLSAKVVIHENCWKCHEVGKGAEASNACEDCHVR